MTWRLFRRGHPGPTSVNCCKITISLSRRLYSDPLSQQIASFANALAGAETTQLTVTRTPVEWGTVTEHLPCLSDSVFVDVVMCASRLSSAGACNVSVCTTPLVPRPKSSSCRWHHYFRPEHVSLGRFSRARSCVCPGNFPRCVHNPNPGFEIKKISSPSTRLLP